MCNKGGHNNSSYLLLVVVVVLLLHDKLFCIAKLYSIAVWLLNLNVYVAVLCAGECEYC